MRLTGLTTEEKERLWDSHMNAADSLQFYNYNFPQSKATMHDVKRMVAAGWVSFDKRGHWFCDFYYMLKGYQEGSLRVVDGVLLYEFDDGLDHEFDDCEEKENYYNQKKAMAEVIVLEKLIFELDVFNARARL